MLTKTARNIGSNPGVKAIIGGTYQIEKPAHGRNIGMLR
jgi:hypothetical protein